MVHLQVDAQAISSFVFKRFKSASENGWCPNIGNLLYLIVLGFGKHATRFAYTIDNSYCMVDHTVRVIQHEGRGQEAQYSTRRVLYCSFETPTQVLYYAYSMNNHAITNLLYLACVGQYC